MELRRPGRGGVAWLPRLPNFSQSTAPISRRSIAKATAVAFVVAMIVLVTAVLPAEYGVDPLGTGRATGLLDLYQAGSAPNFPAEGGPVTPQNASYRTDARKLAVPLLGSVEFKYELAKGQSFVYAWRAPASIPFDFHTEPAGQPVEASETFERGDAAEKQGLYTAPYDGYTDGIGMVVLTFVAMYILIPFPRDEEPATTRMCYYMPWVWQ